jgi:hypothetical protein
MDLMSAPFVLAAAAVLMIAGWLRADRNDIRRARRRRAAGPARSREVRPPAGRSPAVRARSGLPIRRPRPAPPPQLPDEAVLVGPPMVADDATLRDWLVHLHPERRNVWADVVAEFFDALAARPEIADYFGSADRGALQKHFLGAVITLTGTGVTVGTLSAVRSGHSPVRNSRGDGITGEVYDRAMGLLVDVLAAHEVPAPVLGQLEAGLELLRGAVVDPETASTTTGRHARVDPAGPAPAGRGAGPVRRDPQFARASGFRPGGDRDPVTATATAPGPGSARGR